MGNTEIHHFLPPSVRFQFTNFVAPLSYGSGQLTGTWGADGRDVDPTAAFDTTTRTATLADFNGLNPNGDWTLYFRDASPGGISTLNDWSVEVSAVPEPANMALGLFAFVLVVVQSGRMWPARRRERKSGS